MSRISLSLKKNTKMMIKTPRNTAMRVQGFSIPPYLRCYLYVNNLVGDVKANPKDFYRYINSQKKDVQGIPPLKKRNCSGVAQSESEKAAEFNGQFTDVFTKSEYSQVPLLDRSAPFMEDIVVTKEGVIKLLKGLNPSKALGPDELHPRVLKELATELGPIFAHIFQQSINSGDIPNFNFNSPGYSSKSARQTSRQGVSIFARATPGASKFKIFIYSVK